jgi:hypothetical protein
MKMTHVSQITTLTDQINEMYRLHAEEGAVSPAPSDFVRVALPLVENLPGFPGIAQDGEDALGDLIADWEMDGINNAHLATRIINHMMGA